MLALSYDVIIADSNATPILYEGENRTQYFPYESVYAIGEIKSSYYKTSKQPQKFSENVDRLLTNFYREDVPNNYIGHGITLGDGLSSGIHVDKQNEIFSFMVFGSLNDFDEEDMAKQLHSLDGEHPNIMCFLDGSVVTKAHLESTSQGFNLGPLALAAKEKRVPDLHKVSIKFTNEQASASSLTVLMLSLFQHLSRTMLKEPPFGAYVESILGDSSYQAATIKDLS